jgi:serine/threonine protein phosphatase 1
MARTFAIGDVHGCDVALSTLLDSIGLTSDDVIVFLGDLIDRGPGSRLIIERVIALQEELTVIGLCGNHEEMLLQSLERGTPRMIWIGSGGLATLESYGGRLSDFPERHIQFLRSLRDYWETDTHIFVHANVDSAVAMENQSAAILRWQAFIGTEPRHISGKVVVCGHTGQASGIPAVTDGYLCLDTIACAGLWLTCIDVDNQLVWQAKQTGEFRGPLSLEEMKCFAGT